MSRYYPFVRSRSAYNRQMLTVMFFELMKARSAVTIRSGKSGVVELSINAGP
jgi:hypothetical protein